MRLISYHCPAYAVYFVTIRGAGNGLLLIKHSTDEYHKDKTVLTVVLREQLSADGACRFISLMSGARHSGKWHDNIFYFLEHAKSEK